MQISKLSYISIILFFVSIFNASASVKSEADSAYHQGKYEVATKLYEQLAKQGSNADVEYNLGNSYYRQNEIAKAILHYERALLIKPGNSDIRHNLSLARTKITDKQIQEDQFFLTYWVKSIPGKHSSDTWGVCAIISFIVFLLLGISLYFGWLRKINAILPIFIIISLVACIVFNILAFVQNRQATLRDKAIIMLTTSVRSTPDESGTALFQLHPGTKVTLTHDTLNKWSEITLADGKKGWILTNKIEVI